MSTEVGRMVYLYGFVPEDAEVPPPTLTGVGGSSVELLPMAGVAVAVGRLPEDVYGEVALQDRLRDLDWVADQGGRHERVVTWFVDRTDILPVRLLSLYSSLGALEVELEARGERIRAELARLSGLREWDLKVSYDPAKLEKHVGDLSDEVAELDRQIEAAGPGRRYLLERKRADAGHSNLRAVAGELAASLLDEVAETAAEAEVLPLAKEGSALPVVLNAALLVGRDREDELVGRVERRKDALTGRGLRIGFSGPWAPYRFVRIDGSEEEEGGRESDEG